MINKLKLKSKIMESGYTQRTLSMEMGVNKNTLNAKINGKTQFNVNEIELICRLLSINTDKEKCDIFLHQSSQK